MARYVRHLFSMFLVGGLVLSVGDSQAQQLKLGNNPTQINKSAVLQLDSKNQGLLLTRIPDTSVMTLLYPPDGMIIYFTDSISVLEPYGPNAGLYQRKGGAWERISQFFLFKNDSVSGPEFVGFTQSHDTVILHIPDVHADSGIYRGFINGGRQVFAGDKHFSDSLYADSVLVVNGNLILTKSPNMDTLAFLTTDATGLVKLDTLDNVFWLLGGNKLMNPNRDSSLGTINERNLPIITNDSPRMLITSDGKVGIGTNSFGNIDAGDVTDTLTVNGSFKLGSGGSSFSAMARDSFSYQITVNSSYVVPTHFSIPNIKKDAHIIINPRSPLQNGSTIAIISWVRADQNGYITVCFYTTGNNNIPSSGTMKFDVYYINPK